MAKNYPEAQCIRYDWLIKAGLRRFYPDLAAWIVGERPVAVEAVDTAIAVASVRFTDKLLLLRFEKRPNILLHIEFQAEGDRDMPERMAEYLALILGTLKRSGKRPESPACVVIYLDREAYREDPGVLDLEGDLGLKLLLRYKVIKLWEVDPAPILALESPGLCPFLPLMAGNAVDLLLQSQEKIARASEALAPPETKRELLTILAGLATKVIKDRDLIRKLFSEIRIMGENYFFDLIREEGLALGLKQGKDEGTRAAVRHGIQRVLGRRFGEVPEEILRRIDGIVAISDLESLLEEAAICQSFQTFVARLEKS